MLSDALFLATQGRFVAFRLSRGIEIAALYCQAVVNMELEVKRELIIAHYHCHGRGSITRSDDHAVNALPLY